MSTYEYAFDPDGINPDNLIVGETHVISPPSSSDFYFIVPFHAPFFLNNLLIKHYPSGATLVEGVDYGLSYKFLTGSYQTARSIFGAISIFDLTLSGTLEVTYQTLGGKWAIDEVKATELVSNVMHNPRITSWELVADLPDTFPAIEHNHDLQDLVGMGDVVTQLEAIRDAIQGDVQDGNISTQLQSDINNLQTALANHKSSSDHDTRYYTRPEVDDAIANATFSGTSVQNDINQLQTDVTNLQSALNALQTSLDTHKTSGDHDIRYYIKSEVESKIANYMPNVDRIATDNMQISSGERILVDTSTAPLTLVAPVTPSIGDIFSIYDYGGNLSNNPVTIDRNGENIMDLAENIDLNIDNRQYHFEYRDATRGWRIVA